jgi:hypothetical protein
MPYERLWLSESHPLDLLDFVDNRIQGRKWRLFMCACARRCLKQMPSEACRNAVAVGEAYADREASDDAMISAATAAFDTLKPPTSPCKTHSAGCAAIEVASVGGDYLFDCTTRLIDYAAHARGNEAAEYAIQVDLVRDIFGNPFRPPSFSLSWRTDTAVSLARQMYDSREFSAMPILADALQDAGCDNNDILAHCRDATQLHVRGCWVVDLVLGKT